MYSLEVGTRRMLRSYIGRKKFATIGTVGEGGASKMARYASTDTIRILKRAKILYLYRLANNYANIGVKRKTRTKTGDAC